MDSAGSKDGQVAQSAQIIPEWDVSAAGSAEQNDCQSIKSSVSGGASVRFAESSRNNKETYPPVAAIQNNRASINSTTNAYHTTGSSMSVSDSLTDTNASTSPLMVPRKKRSMDSNQGSCPIEWFSMSAKDSLTDTHAPNSNALRKTHERDVINAIVSSLSSHEWDVTNALGSSLSVNNSSPMDRNAQNVHARKDSQVGKASGSYIHRHPPRIGPSP